MPRFDVHRLPSGTQVINIQTDLLDHLATRAVIPLLPFAQSPRPIAGLNPVLDLAGIPHVLLTQAIASVPTRELARPIASLAHRHDDILRAIHILLTGL